MDRWGLIIGTITAQPAASAEQQAGQLMVLTGLLVLALFLGAWWQEREKRLPLRREPFCPWGIIDVGFALAAFAALVVAASFALAPWFPAGAGKIGWAPSVATSVAGVGMALVILTLLHLRYGLWPRDAGLTFECWPRDLLLALGLFSVVLALRLPMAELFQYLHARAGEPLQHQLLVEEMLRSRQPLALAVTALAALVVAPLWEEVAFRGFLQPFLRRFGGARAAIVLTAAAFSAIHDWDSRFFMTPIMMFPLALALSYAYERTGRLAAPILLHLLNNSLTVVTVFFVRGTSS